jgi:hypothetical protein
MKTNDDYVNKRKTEHGVSVKAFKEFFVKDNKVFSIDEIERYKGKMLLNL